MSALHKPARHSSRMYDYGAGAIDYSSTTSLASLLGNTANAGSRFSEAPSVSVADASRETLHPGRDSPPRSSRRRSGRGSGRRRGGGGGPGSIQAPLLPAALVPHHQRRARRAVATLFMTLYPVVKAIAQLVVDRIMLNVDVAVITAPQTGSLALALQGVVTPIGIFAATNQHYMEGGRDAEHALELLHARTGSLRTTASASSIGTALLSNLSLAQGNNGLTTVGWSTTTSPALDLDMNFDPSSLFMLARVLAVQAGESTEQIDGIVQLGGYKYVRADHDGRDAELPAARARAPDRAEDRERRGDGIDTVLISDPGEAAFTTTLTGSITNAGPFDAQAANFALHRTGPTSLVTTTILTSIALHQLRQQST
ncbi:hypothetical protein HWV62_28276 [Athelia sp. TMB]|nr:hypothetical protein HWV62_28276 [Athelia sp. TMB]